MVNDQKGPNRGQFVLSEVEYVFVCRRDRLAVAITDVERIDCIFGLTGSNADNCDDCTLEAVVPVDTRRLGFKPEALAALVYNSHHTWEPPKTLFAKHRKMPILWHHS